MISCEKDLEDYICQNIDNFIKDMKASVWKFRDKDIKFVGRQVRIGGQIADLVFYYDEIPQNDLEIELITKTFIIVELKYRICEPKDLSQLAKYLNLFNALDDKYFDEDNYIQINAEGVLLGFDLDNNLQEIQMQMNNMDTMHFMNINQTIGFKQVSYSLKEEYIKEVQVDDRVSRLCKGGELVGKKKND